MDDYISRQAAIIQLSHNKSRGDDEWMLAVESDMGVIRALPVADVVPVVRCRDCKFRENDDFCTGRGFPYQLVPDDGFCDKGKRKE